MGLLVPFASTATYPAAPFGGITAHVIASSTAVVFSGAVTLPIGTPLVFAGVTYFLAAAIAAGTSGTLTVAYAGATNTAIAITYPWSGQPTKVAPVYTYFTPGQTPTASELNSLFNIRDAAINATITYAASLALGNWKPPVATFDPGSIGGTDPGALTVQSVAWDSLLQRWVIAAVGGGAAYLFATHSSGDVLDTITPGPGGAAADVGGVLAGACDAAGNTVFFKTFSISGPATRTSCLRTIASGPIVDTTQTFLNTLTQAAVQGLGASGFLMVGFEQAGSTYTGHLAVSANGAGVWTDDTSSLPATWQTGTGVVQGVVCGFDSTLASTSPVMFGMCLLGSSRLIAGSPTIADITPSFLTTRNIKGIAYNTVLGVWGILCDDGAGVYLYTSPDQVTWTLAKTFQALASGGLQAIGGVWVAQLTIVDPGGFPAGNDRIVLSADGGSTWTTASYAMGGDSVSGPMKFPRLVSNGVQLVALNNAQHDFSLQAGFTAAGGF